MPGLVVLGGDDRIEGVTQKVYFKGMDGTHPKVDKLDEPGRWVRATRSRWVD